MTSSVTEAKQRVLPRTLAGATVLQVITTLDDTLLARATLDVARALVYAGARVILAGEHGDLVEELESFGGEWLPLSIETRNPLKARSNIEVLGRIIAQEKVALVHAVSPGTARIARIAARNRRIPLITELPDMRHVRMWLAAWFGLSIVRGDRVISHSLYNAEPMIARLELASGQIAVVPSSLDLRHFNPTAVTPERVTALRQSWGIPYGVRIATVPGAITAGNGHLVLIEAARILSGWGIGGVTFVLAGSDRYHRRFVRRFWKRAQRAGVDALFRIIGETADMREAYAAADFVVVPYTSAPTDSSMVAEAQAMGKPVIVSDAGPLSEVLAAPPHVAEQLRTGWVVKPGDPDGLARAIEAGLSLDPAAYRALALRVRHFAEDTFSPKRTSDLVIKVYRSLFESKG